MKIENANQKPKRFFGLHMVEGVAEYRESDREPYRILVGEDTIKNMDPTFEGCPVYVQHVDVVDLKNIQAEADGYVVRSFFNQNDGKHWVEFIVVSDAGHEALRKGWKLSNAYIPKQVVGGGLWHGVQYEKEVMSGEYEHLAIVPNPRYAESIVLTPEEFKKYNGEKEIELLKLTNSKEGEKGMLSFFKKSKVDNSADLETMSVTLPKSKKEKTITQLVNEADEMEMNAEKPVMANGDHHVMVGEDKMTVNELVQKHLDCMNEMAEMKKPVEPVKPKEENSEDEEAKKKALELAAHEQSEMEKKKNEEEEEKKKQNAAHFETLKNAQAIALAKSKAPKIELSEDKVKRGQARYGSKK